MRPSEAARHFFKLALESKPSGLELEIITYPDRLAVSVSRASFDRQTDKVAAHQFIYNLMAGMQGLTKCTLEVKENV